MDFNKAISAHSAWKRRLRACLSRPDHSIEAAAVAASDQCDLGRWIAGDGRKHATLPEFGVLLAEHIRFHKAAADIVARANAGEDVAGELVPGANSEFTQASANVVRALIEMQKKETDQDEKARVERYEQSASLI